MPTKPQHFEIFTQSPVTSVNKTCSFKRLKSLLHDHNSQSERVFSQLCKGFQIAAPLVTNPLWSRSKWTLASTKLAHQNFFQFMLVSHYLMLERNSPGAIKKSYRVFFSKGPTQKSSNYGIGPTQQDKMAKYTGPTQSYQMSELLTNDFQSFLFIFCMEMFIQLSCFILINQVACPYMGTQ